MNHALDGGPDLPREGAISGKGSPTVKGTFSVSCSETTGDFVRELFGNG